MNELESDRLAAMMRALSHPVRIEIVRMLADSGDAMRRPDAARALAQSTVSEHLRVLKEAGLIKQCGPAPIGLLPEAATRCSGSSRWWSRCERADTLLQRLGASSSARSRSSSPAPAHRHRREPARRHHARGRRRDVRPRDHGDDLRRRPHLRRALQPGRDAGLRDCPPLPDPRRRAVLG